MQRMLRWVALGGRGLAVARAGTRTAWRRPLVIAIASGLAILRLLPSGAAVLPVQILGPGGGVEQVFAVAVDDPQLEALRIAAEAALRPNYRKRSPDYYRAQWDAATAEFYLSTARPADGEDTPGATQPTSGGELTHRSPARAPAAVEAVIHDVVSSAVAGGAGQGAETSAAGEVSRASYQEVAPALGASAMLPPQSQDWSAFWRTRQQLSNQRLRALEPPPSVDPIFARLRFGTVSRQPQSTLVVFAVLCAAGVVFTAARWWACAPPPRRIGLRANCRLVIPATWVRRRFLWRELRRELTRGRALEGAAILAIFVLLLG